MSRSSRPIDAWHANRHLWKPQLYSIALVVMGWFANDIRAYGVSKFLDHYLTPEQRASLSDEDIQRIIKAAQASIEGKVAKAPVQQIYRELERDTAIKGVGASTVPGVRPPNIVPRDEFQTRAGLVSEADNRKPSKRAKITKERVTLISPVLLPRDRSWKFYAPQYGEFGAKIKDEKFLDSILSGKRKISMRVGIQLDVELETIEERIGHVWLVKDRTIKNVIRVRPALSLARDLFSSN
jgi:hypothetical protein